VRLLLQHLPHLLPVAFAAVIGVLCWRARRAGPAPEEAAGPDPGAWPGDLAPAPAAAPPVAAPVRRRARRRGALVLIVALAGAGGFAGALTVAAAAGDGARGGISLDAAAFWCDLHSGGEDAPAE